MKHILQGIIVAQNERTLTVEVRRTKRHPLYGKSYEVTKRYRVDSPMDGYTINDVVSFIDSSPKSKTKHWRVQ